MPRIIIKIRTKNKIKKQKSIAYFNAFSGDRGQTEKQKTKPLHTDRCRNAQEYESLEHQKKDNLAQNTIKHFCIYLCAMAKEKEIT